MHCSQLSSVCVDPYPDGFEAESFDRVLLDAPCSALGLRPRLNVAQTLQELEQAAEYQRRLMREAAHLLRVGGCLVFSTCTFNPRENEANVLWFLTNFTQFALVDQHPKLGQSGLCGGANVPRADGSATWEQYLNDEDAQKVQCFGSAGCCDTIAFFVAKFVKRSSVPAGLQISCR
jgi:methyltransferase NSUN6